MDKLEALYNSYIEAGLLSSSTTLDQFALANDNIINALYQQGIDSNILSKSTSIDLFKSAWTEKKSQDTTIQISQEGLEYPSEDVLSASPQSRRARQEVSPYDINQDGVVDDKDNDTWVERTFGYNWFTDFLGDMYRAKEVGALQGKTAGEATDLFVSGQGNLSRENIEQYVNAARDLRDAPVSDEMKDFQKTIDEYGGGVKGFLIGLATNPSVAPAVVVTSLRGMLNKAGAAGAAAGGAVGSAVPVLGTAAGAIAGATLGTETSLSFSEFIQEELNEQNMELTADNVEALFQDPEAISRIKNKALLRGFTIAAIDAITAKMGGRVIKEGVRTAKRVKAGAKALGVEMAGGGIGEAGARAVTGQEMDVAEIGLETVSPGVITGVNATKAILFPGKYELGSKDLGAKQPVTGKGLIEFLDTATDEQILEAEITVTNDKELSAEVDQRIREAKAGMDLKENYGLNYTKLDETQANKLKKAEADLMRLQGKSFKSFLDKKKIKALETQLENLSIEYGLLEEGAPEVTPEAAPEVVAEEVKIPIEQLKEENTFTHQTRSEDAIINWANSGKVVGKNEDISTFDTRVAKTLPEKAQKIGFNRQSPNFQKGGLFGDKLSKGVKYVVVSKNQENFIPSDRFMNVESYERSQGIATLIPGARDISNFDLYSVNEDGSLTKRNWNEFKTKPEAAPEVAPKTEEVVEEFIGEPLIPIVPDQAVPSVVEALPENLKSEFMLKQKETSPTSALREILKTLPEETRNKVSNDIKNKIAEVDIAEKKDKGLVSREIDGNKFDNIDPNTNEPTAVELEDSVVIVRNEDGTYTDGDSVYESFSELMEQQRGMDMTSPTVFTEQNQRQSITEEVEAKATPEVAPEVTEEVVVQELPENVPFRSDKQKGIVQDLLNENYTSENLASDFEAGRIKVGKDGKLTRESIKEITALSKTEPVETAKTLEIEEVTPLFEQALDARFQVEEGVPMDQADVEIYEGLKTSGFDKIVAGEIKSKEDINDFLAETMKEGKKFSEISSQPTDKVLDYIADLKKQLDQFGLAIGLAPAAAKAVLTAIETGVKAKRALVQVAKEVGKKFNVPYQKLLEILDNTRERLDKRLLPLKQVIVNKYIKPFRMQEAIEKTKEVAQEEDFKTAITLLPGKVQEMLKANATRIENIVSEVSKAFPSREVALQKLDDYLYALHAPERNRYIIETVPERKSESLAPSGMYSTIEDVNTDLEAGILTEEQANDIIDNGQTAKQIRDSFTGRQTEALRKARREVRTILKENLDALKDKGLITEKEYQTIIDNPYNDYVPLTNFDSDVDIDLQYVGGFEATRRLPIRGKEMKAAKGRTSKAGSILANILQLNQRRILRQEKNTAVQRLYNFMKENPDVENYRVIEFKKPNTAEANTYARKAERGEVIPVKIKGKYAYIEFADPTINKAFFDNRDLLNNKIIKGFSKANNFLRGLYTTYSPEFLLVNNLRDVQTAILNALSETDIQIRNKAKFVSDIIKDDIAGIKNIFKIEMGDPEAMLQMTERQLKRKGLDKSMVQDYLEFKKLGGSTGFINQKSYENILQDLTKDVNKAKEKGRIVSKSAIGKFVDAVGNASENATRLAGFRAAKKAGLSPEKAAALAKNLTVNFNQRGTSSEVINALYLFFNASVQGTANFIKSITRLKTEYTEEGKKKYALNPTQKIAMGMVLGGFFLNKANRGLSDEDEDGVLYYDKIPWYEKERNLIIMKPDGKGYLKFPLPYGYNLFANIGDLAADVGSKDKTVKDALGDLAKSSIGAFSPITPSEGRSLLETGVKTLTPTATRPIVDVAFKTTRFGTPLTAPQFDQDKPISQTAKASTSEEAKSFAKFLNELTGGTTQRKGLIDIAPETIPYLFDQYLGTVGRLGRGGVEAVLDADRDLEKDVEEKDKPIIRRFSGEVSRYKDVVDMYDRMTAIETYNKELKDILERKEDKELFEKEKKIYRNAKAYEAIVKSVKKQLKEIRKQKDDIKKARSLDKISYQREYDLLKKLEEKEDKIADKFNKSFLKRFSRSSKKGKLILKN